MNDTVCSVVRSPLRTRFELSPNLDGREPAWKHAAATIAIVGLYAMAVGMGGFKALQNTGSALLLLGSLPFLPAIADRVKHSPGAWLVIAFMAYVLVRTAIASWMPHPPDVDHWYQARRIARILLVPIAAWWIGGHHNRMIGLALCVLAGLILAIAEQCIGWGSIAPMFEGSRVEFRMHPIRMAAMSGVAVVGLLIFVRPFVACLRPRIGSVFSFAAWLVLVALMIQAFIVSQTRGAYVAFLLLGVGWAAAVFWRYRGSLPKPTLQQLLAPALVGLVLLGAMATQWSAVTDKFENESGVMLQAMSGDWDNPEPNSFGTRIYLYKWGLEAAFTKPWFGWGTDGPMEVIRHTGKSAIPDRYNHFHNNYIDFVVRFGIVGSLIFAAMLWAWIRAGRRSMREGTLDRRLLTLLVVTIAAFGLGSLSFSFLESSHGWFLLIFLGGMMLSPGLWREQSRMTH